MENKTKNIFKEPSSSLDKIYWKRARLIIIIVGIIVLIVGILFGIRLFDEHQNPNYYATKKIYKKLDVDYKRSDYNIDKTVKPIADAPKQVQNKTSDAGIGNVTKSTYYKLNRSKATNQVLEQDQDLLTKFHTKGIGKDKYVSPQHEFSTKEVVNYIIDITHSENNFVWNQYIGTPKDKNWVYKDKGYDGVRKYNFHLAQYAMGTYQFNLQESKVYYENPDEQVKTLRYDVWTHQDFKGPSDYEKFDKIYKNYAKMGFPMIDKIDSIVLKPEFHKFDRKFHSVITAYFVSNGKTYKAYIGYFGNDKNQTMLKMMDLELIK